MPHRVIQPGCSWRQENGKSEGTEEQLEPLGFLVELSQSHGATPSSLDSLQWI